MRTTRQTAFAFAVAAALVSASLATGLTALLFPPQIAVPLGDGAALVVWRHSVLAGAGRWPLVAGCVLLALLTVRAGLRARRGAAVPPALRIALEAAASAALLPPLAAVLLLADLLPAACVASALILVPCCAGAWTVSRLYEGLCAPGHSPEPRLAYARDVAAILLLSLACYTGIGVFVANRVGDVVGGDESAYILLAGSLWNDRDVDLRNDWELARGGKPRATPEPFMHVSANCRGDHWYTWHLPGLPLLLAPAHPLGRWGRYGVLALLGALTNAGIYACCRDRGASRRSSLLCLAGVAVSVVWTFYASRALAEMLGAALLTWLAWAVFAVRRRPFATLAVACVCIPWLSLTSTRFLPLAAVGGAAFVAATLFSGLPSHRKAIAVGVVAAAAAAAHAVLFAVLSTQFTMTGSGLYARTLGLLLGAAQPYGMPAIAADTLFKPLGMWAALADTMGLISVLPCFLLLAAACLTGCARRGIRAAAWLALALLGMCLATSCANTFVVGPGAVPGRYLVAVLPAMLPPLAWFLDRTSAPARVWFLLLCALSAALTMLMLTHLDRTQTDFGVPWHSLANVDPLLRHVWHPYAAVLEPSTTLARWASAAYICAGALLSLLLLRRAALPRRLLLPAAGAFVALAALAHAVQPVRLGQNSYEAKLASRCLAGINPSEAGMEVRMPDGGEWDQSHRGGMFSFRMWINGVTARDLGALLTPARMISLPRVPPNDWNQRPMRWATLVAPYKPVAGEQIVFLDGRLNGATQIVAAVREGSQTLFEQTVTARDGRVSARMPVRCRGRRGDLYILVWIEGSEGAFHIERMAWTPGRVVGGGRTE